MVNRRQDVEMRQGGQRILRMARRPNCTSMPRAELALG